MPVGQRTRWRTLLVCATSILSLLLVTSSSASADSTAGYWLVSQTGGVYPFGDAPFYGSAGGVTSSRSVVAMAVTPDGKGYWLAAANGAVFHFGDARFYGPAGGVTSSRPVVAMAVTPDGKGYWLAAANGAVFHFGDAQLYGPAGGVTSSRPVVAMAATPDGKGYWLAAANGAVFHFGDARFYGPAGGSRRLARSSPWLSPLMARATGWQPPTVPSSISATLSFMGPPALSARWFRQRSQCSPPLTGTAMRSSSKTVVSILMAMRATSHLKLVPTYPPLSK